MQPQADVWQGISQSPVSVRLYMAFHVGMLKWMLTCPHCSSGFHRKHLSLCGSASLTHAHTPQKEAHIYISSACFRGVPSSTPEPPPCPVVYTKWQETPLLKDRDASCSVSSHFPTCGASVQKGQSHRREMPLEETQKCGGGKQH